MGQILSKKSSDLPEIVTDKLNVERKASSYLSIALCKRLLRSLSCLGLLMIVVYCTFIPPGPFPETIDAAVRLDKPVTVVTAFYNIPSKRSNESYYVWMRNFLSLIPCHLYIYTEESELRRVMALRKSLTDKTKIIVKPFTELKMAKREYLWEKQREMDPEKRYHSKELYILWNEKVNFLLETIRDNAFDSDYFLWTDIGCFRDTDKALQLTDYPDTKLVNKYLGTDKIFFLQMSPLTLDDQIIGSNGIPKHDFKNDETKLAGTIFGGHKKAVLQYGEVYYPAMDMMVRSGRFIGKDQNLMSAIAVMYPQLFHLVSPRPYLQDGDLWFYGQYCFSHKEDNITG